MEKTFVVGERVQVRIAEPGTWTEDAVRAMDGVEGVVEEVKPKYGPWPAQVTGYLVRFDKPVMIRAGTEETPRAAFHFLGADLREDFPSF